MSIKEYFIDTFRNLSYRSLSYKVWEKKENLRVKFKIGLRYTINDLYRTDADFDKVILYFSFGRLQDYVENTLPKLARFCSISHDERDENLGVTYLLWTERNLPNDSEYRVNESYRVELDKQIDIDKKIVELYRWWDKRRTRQDIVFPELLGDTAEEYERFKKELCKLSKQEAKQYKEDTKMFKKLLDIRFRIYT